MKNEQTMRREVKKQGPYVVKDKDFKELKFDRDDILQEAALILEADPKFPDSRGEMVNLVRAKQAIREALKKRGARDYFDEEQGRQIGDDAHEVLSLFNDQKK
ncbi:MAG: hypothetical protein AAB575_01710 [Patescibacteria group bacterium]